MVQLGVDTVITNSSTVLTIKVAHSVGSWIADSTRQVNTRNAQQAPLTGNTKPSLPLLSKHKSRDNLGGGWEKIARLTTSLPPLAWEAWYYLATAIARYKAANGLHPVIMQTLAHKTSYHANCGPARQLSCKPRPSRACLHKGLHPLVTPTPCLGSMANQGYKHLLTTRWQQDTQDSDEI